MIVKGDEPSIGKKKDLKSILKSNQKVFSNFSVPGTLPDCNFNKPVINTTNIINGCSEIVAQEICKNTKDENRLGENRSSLPEKSLPLKKKAKMKRTDPNALINLPGDSNANLVKNDFISTSVKQGKQLNGKP